MIFNFLGPGLEYCLLFLPGISFHVWRLIFLLGLKLWPIYRKTVCTIIYIYGHIIRITPMKKNSVLSFYFK